MTHLNVITALVATALCLPAFAMGKSAVELDANEDGVMSIEEVQAVYPEVTMENFATADLNGDGTLGEVEFLAAQEAGLMP